ncbi:MAG: inositol monophosphatase family protein [Acidimicrobiales bacterium]
MDATATWALFDEIAVAVRDRVLHSDRGAPGERPGQYGLDVAADAVMVDMLLAAGFGVLSEESGRQGHDRVVCVVADPVDGSTNASRGLPCWAISLCAVDAEGPWVATVVDQSRGVTYRAERGRGATRTDAGGTVSIAVAAPTSLADAIVAVNGRSSAWPEARQYRALGSAAIELCLVADGSLDGYANLDGDAHGSWDYLGAALVLTEAGGVIADRQGRELASLEHAERRSIVAASDRALLTAMMNA